MNSDLLILRIHVLTWCGTSSSYPLLLPVAQQAIATNAERERWSYTLLFYKKVEQLLH